MVTAASASYQSCCVKRSYVSISKPKNKIYRYIAVIIRMYSDRPCYDSKR